MWTDEQKARAARWGSMLLLALVATAVAHVALAICSPWIAAVLKVSERVSAASVTVPWIGGVFFEAVVGLLIATIVARSAWGRPAPWLLSGRFRHPPIGLPILLGSGTLFWLYRYVDADERLWQISDLTVLVAPCLGLGAGLLVAWLVPIVFASREQPVGSTHKLDSIEGIRAWIRDDRPVDHPDRDIFGHHAIAKRIQHKLMSGRNTSVVLTGDIGSGKTTVYELLRHEWRSESKVAIGRVSAWEFADTNAMIRAVLREIVRLTGQHAQTLSISGVPEEYLRAIESGGIVQRSLAMLLGSGTEPHAVVRRIGHVLEATDRRVVIWIDDLERLKSRRDRDGLRNSLGALLHTFDLTPNLSFVFASTHGLVSDSRKVGVFRERIPSALDRDVVRVIRVLRNAALSLNGIIDPVMTDDRARRFVNTDDEVAEIIYGMSEAKKGIVPLLLNPRTLKAAIRQADMAWRTLHGEIDFDDLLAMSALRMATPHLFEFIDKHYRQLRDPEHGILITDKDKQAARMELWSSLLAEAKKDGYLADAAVRVVQDVFPLAEKPGNEEMFCALRPQGVGVGPPIALAECGDYYVRCVTESADDCVYKDRDILGATRDWQAASDDRLVQAFVDDQIWRRKLEQFSTRMFGNDDYIRFVREVVDAAATRPPAEDGMTYQEDGRVGSFVALWRMILHAADVSRSQLTETLSAVVRAHIGRAGSVYFCNECVKRFVNSNAGTEVADVLRESERIAVSAAYREALWNAIGSAETRDIQNMFAGPHPYVLAHALHLATVGMPPEEDGTWAVIGSRILEAARTNVDGLMVQIVMLTMRHVGVGVVEDSEGNEVAREIRKFEPEWIFNFFPKNLLVEAIAQTTASTTARPEVQEWMRIASRSAQERLSSERSSHED